MKKKQMYLFNATIWFLTAGIWSVTLFLNIYRQTITTITATLYALCVLLSFGAGISNYALYWKTKQDQASDPS